jgi:hypothetical protein
MMTPMANSDSGWYSVRCVFRSLSGSRWGPPDLASGESAYEERVTLWRTESADVAIERAEEEAHRYAADTDSEYLGIAQSYRMADEPGEGAEVFVLVRRSILEADPYLDAFFDTGSEFEQQD